jgi:Cu/Ag efflux pump CusA
MCFRFGELIILIVYIQFTLRGIEGKTLPMAQTIAFALIAFILSLTYVPMMTALF